MAAFHVGMVLPVGSRENPGLMVKVHRLARKRRLPRAAHLMGNSGEAAGAERSELIRDWRSGLNLWLGKCGWTQASWAQRAVDKKSFPRYSGYQACSNRRNFRAHPAGGKWRISLVKHIGKCREINTSYFFFNDKCSKIDKKQKILIASNNSSFTQHLFVPGTVLSTLHLVSFQKHGHVDTIIIHILTIRVRVVHSASVMQLINDRTRAQTRSVWHQSPFFLTTSLECLSEESFLGGNEKLLEILGQNTVGKMILMPVQRLKSF